MFISKDNYLLEPKKKKDNYLLVPKKKRQLSSYKWFYKIELDSLQTIKWY
jgi:hypothetical protein